MPKEPQDRKHKAPKSKNLTGKRPAEPATPGAPMREVTNQLIGDVADTITRKKKPRH